MNEIKKMYENAEVKPVCDGLDCFTCTAKCNNGKYPEFTAEKQIELIKWLAKIGIKIDKVNGEFTSSIFGIISDFSPFEESLANLINNIWKNLTDDEKQQVKRILE